MLIRIWYNYAAPAPAGLLFGALGLSVWRVSLHPRTAAGGRGTLPPWLDSPSDPVPSLDVGE